MGTKCSFINYLDIDYDQRKKEDCAKACLNTKGCTHFDWGYNVCFRKWGFVSKNDAFWSGNKDFICGIIVSRSTLGKSSNI